MQMATQDGINDNPISVLEIIGSATRGGMENQIVNLLKNLPKDRFRITCICPCESLFTAKLRQMGVEGVYVTPIADNPDWRSIQTTMEVASLHQVDILHAHMPKSHVLAGIAASLLNKPVVATVHGMHVTAHELGVALAVKSHLITNCQETYIQALALGIPEKKVNLFHNGVDTKVFTPAGSREKFRAMLNLTANSKLVGFVGRLEYDKGPDLFLHAASVIHEAMPDVHFAIVGAGSMLAQLQSMSSRMQLTQCLHFVDWCTSVEDIYPGFDLMTHTSRNDGTSLVMLEAMACGCPVVALAVGGLREMVENEHTGMLADPGDWEGLAHQAITMLKQPDLLKTMSVAARSRAVSHFSVTINAQKTAHLLEQTALSYKQDEQAVRNFLPVYSANGNGQ